MARCRLGDLVYRVKDSVDRLNTELIYYVGGEHFDSRSLTVNKKGIIQGSTIGPAFNTKFKAGDVLLMSRNPHLRKAGMVNFDGICSDVSYIIRTRDENILLQSLIPIIFQSDLFWTFAEKHKKGSTNFFLNWSDFENFEFDLPSLDEQRQLSNVVWSMKETEDSYLNLIEKTDELVKSQFIEMFGNPQNNPKSVPFEFAFTIRDDLRKPLNDTVRSDMKDGLLYPYYGANGEVDRINDYLMDCDAICLAEDCGSYGPGENSSYIVTGKCWVNNHAHVLIPKDVCNIEYANVFFRVLDMRGFVSGTTRLKLTQAKMKEIPIVLPEIKNQIMFASLIRQIDKSKFLEKRYKIYNEGGNSYVNF